MITAYTCRWIRGRYSSLAISLLLLLANATSSQLTGVEAITRNEKQVQRSESRHLAAKAGDKPGRHVHHGPRIGKSGKNAALSGTTTEVTSDLVANATSYIDFGGGSSKSGKDIAVAMTASEGLSGKEGISSIYAYSGAGSSKAGKDVMDSMTTPTTYPIMDGVGSGSVPTAESVANVTSQSLGEVASGSMTTPIDSAYLDSAYLSDMSVNGKASKNKKGTLDISTPTNAIYTTTPATSAVYIVKGSDIGAKSSKAVVSGSTMPIYSESASKSLNESVTSSVKPKAIKTPIAQNFVKDSSYSEAEITSHISAGGKSGKAGSGGVSIVDVSMSYNLASTAKAYKADGSSVGMSSDTSPGITPAPAPVPTKLNVTSSPVSGAAVSAEPSPLLTLPPTNLASSTGSTSPPVLGRRYRVDAKYWPHEKPDGGGQCEFSINYPPEFAQEQLREVYLFDTLDECCAMYELFCLPTFPTYSPTGDLQLEGQEPVLSIQGENVVVLEPFGIKLLADQAEPNYNEETVVRVTKEHLTHSFRTHGYEVSSLTLLVLEHERHLTSERNPAVATSAVTLRWLEQHPVYDVVMGGAIEFTSGAKMPSGEDIKKIVEASFSGERLAYYIELLNEANIDVANAKLDSMLVQESATDGGARSGFNWAGLGIGMSSALIGIGLIAVGSRHVYKRRQLSIDDLDLEKGFSEDYTIRLQYTNDELEGTVDETATHDQLSVPSLVRSIEDEVNYQATPNGTRSYSSYGGEPKGKGNVISPLESPQDTNKEATKRYISVFTVKKDCGGKTLDQVDLRALAIAYLSRMLKKFPNTYLLPHDKTSNLPAITYVRDIPDDLEVLHQYIGNARVDEKTGKVLFNLRVESDEPVSKMKSHASGSSRKVSFNPPAVEAVKPKKVPDSPKSPESMEDVDL